MRPRIVFRTHYQVDEPAYMEFLVTRCTSPVKSNYREVVAQKISSEIRKRGKSFNIAAGGYAVDLAHDLDLITENHTWTEKGLLLFLFADVQNDRPFEDQLELNAREKISHFRVFLDNDGAGFLFLARRLLDSRTLDSNSNGWNALAQEMFTSVFQEYLSYIDHIAERVKLRNELQRITNKGYTGNSGAHKLFVHLQTMKRLDMIDREDLGGSRIYKLPVEGKDAIIRSFVDQISDAVSLERVIEENSGIERIAGAYGFARQTFEGIEESAMRDPLIKLIHEYYSRIMSTGIPICPVGALLQALQIEVLTRDGILIPYDKLLDFLINEQKRRSKEIRFHVNRQGKIAFIRISNGRAD